jgi:type II secretory pathway component PulC
VLAGQVKAYFAKHGPALAAAVLGLAIALQAFEFVTDARTFLAAERAPMRHSGPATRSVNVEQITSAHLFGQPATSAASSSADAPVTLVLAGVIASDDPGQGMGILGPTAIAAKLYSVGDPLPGGGLLRSVYPDHVLFETSGSVQTLYLQKRSAVAGISAAATARPADVAETLAEATPQASSEPSENPPRLTSADRRGMVARAQQDYQQRTAGN